MKQALVSSTVQGGRKRRWGIASLPIKRKPPARWRLARVVSGKQDCRSQHGQGATAARQCRPALIYPPVRLVYRRLDTLDLKEVKVLLDELAA
jgi:hypothetical protein